MERMKIAALFADQEQLDGKEVTVYTEPENVLHDEDVEDFSAEEIAALLAD